MGLVHSGNLCCLLYLASTSRGRKRFVSEGDGGRVKSPED